MVQSKKGFWISLSLINLCIVALLGLTLRSKILFELPFLDYRNFLSAHSHFAFSGWVGLALFTLYIYEILPKQMHRKPIYQWLLWGLELSSLGMAAVFPVSGYDALSIFFSTLYIIVALVFIVVFLKDLNKSAALGNVKLLCWAALLSMLLSFVGPLGLAYIIVSGSMNSLLYRFSIYIFLHFQYNGFFTLSIFALLFKQMQQGEFLAGAASRRFCLLLVLSILPSLFFSLLWLNQPAFYMLAGIACSVIAASLVYFFRFLGAVGWRSLIPLGVSRKLLLLACIAFVIKMLLQMGTIIPALGNAVYGDRPVIIGFLHLVFLGLVSFFILSRFVSGGFFTRGNRVPLAPFVLFGSAVVSNEVILMVQGLGILFKTNSQLFSWLLWAAAILLFAGALSIALLRLYVSYNNGERRPT